MANLIFPTGFDEKTTIAQDDYILMADSEDNNRIKKAKYSNLKGEKGDTGPKGEDGADGQDGADGTSATITIGSTTTGAAGSDASVTNTGTSSAAVLNFTIPQGVAGTDGKDGVDGKDGKDGTDGQDGAAATITVGTTTTGSPGTNASVTNTGTSSAAVFDFTIPQGATGATGNGVASITSSKNGKITTVTITETNGDVETFTVSDGADGQGAGDVVGPNSATDGHLAVFDGADGKHIKDGGSVPTGFNPGAGTTGQVLKKTNDGYGWANESGAVTSVNGQTGAVTLTIPSDTGDLTNGAGYITGISSGDVTTALGYTPANSANLGTAAACNTGTSSGNVPVLDSNGKLATSTLPGVALTDTFTVSTSADLTTLSSADQGDIAIVTSENKTYVLSVAPYSTASNWKEILAPTGGVTSVNGNTGAVTVNDVKVSATAPSSPTEGMVCYDTTNDQLKVYDGSAWQVTGKEYNAGAGIVIGSIHKDTQGPAPDGFHIPTLTEWLGLYNMLNNSLYFTSGNQWRINLHMPFAGNRSDGDASLRSQGSMGCYWSSSTNGSTSAHYLYLDSGSIGIGYSNVRAGGLSIRPFKDEFVTPTSSWTVIQGTLGSAGIFWDQTNGLISITDGTTGYTIQDKNLGATTVYNDGYTLTEANMGKMYQWGNNYGFPSTGTISDISSTQVDASSYGPGNYYSSSTFITTSASPYDWSSVQNDNLWGGVTDGTWIGGDGNTITNTGVLSVNGETGDVTVAGGIQNDTTGTTTTMTKIRAGTEAEFALITPTSGVEYHVYPN